MTDDKTTGGARRVLIVEDDAPIREVIANHLRKKGFAVTEAGDAETVLLRMSRERVPFDLVLTDIHLPGLSGVELLRLLLTHSPLKPVIVITGDSDEALAQRALRFGATGYLLKPFELFEVEVAVRQAVSRLELVEAAEHLARSDAERRRDGEAAAGSLPAAWLELADTRSSAGPGHGYRVARIAGAVVAALDEPLTDEEREALDTAARAHELGRLLGPAATPGEMATRTAQFLFDLDAEPATLRIINHMRERWDGTGGPHGLSGADIPQASMVLAAADTVDHRAMLLVESGMEPSAAIVEALGDVKTEGKAAFGPAIGAVSEAGSVIEAIWVLARGYPTDAGEEAAGAVGQSVRVSPAR